MGHHFCMGWDISVMLVNRLTSYYNKQNTSEYLHLIVKVSIFVMVFPVVPDSSNYRVWFFIRRYEEIADRTELCMPISELFALRRTGHPACRIGQGRPPQALSDCKSSLIAGISMMAAITRLIIGSMMCRPVLDITRPEMRTPTETSVSDTICRKEALMLISRS